MFIDSLETHIARKGEVNFARYGTFKLCHFECLNICVEKTESEQHTRINGLNNCFYYKIEAFGTKQAVLF